MDDERITNSIATLSKQLLILESNQAALRAAVSVLKCLTAIEMSPDDPLEALNRLQGLEKMLLKSDPNALARQEAAEVIEAVRLWKKLGGGHHES